MVERLPESLSQLDFPIFSAMDKIVVFETFYNPIEANIIKARLMDSGIQCFLSDENSVTLNPLYTQALGGIKLHLFEKDVELAASILQQEITGSSLDEEMETVPAEEVAPQTTAAFAGTEGQGALVCPNCGSTHVGYVQATKNRFNLPTMVVSFLLMVYPFQVNKVNHCFDCLHEFDPEENNINKA